MGKEVDISSFGTASLNILEGENGNAENLFAEIDDSELTECAECAIKFTKE